MSQITINIDIDVDDMMGQLDDREIGRIISWLKENGNIPESEFNAESETPGEEIFVEDLIKIRDKYMTLSADDLELLNEIAQR